MVRRHLASNGAPPHRRDPASSNTLWLMRLVGGRSGTALARTPDGGINSARDRILLSLPISHDRYFREIRWRGWRRYDGNWRGRRRRSHRLGDHPTDILLANTTIRIPT